MLFLRLQKGVLYNNIGRKSDKSDTKAREYLAEHSTALEDRVLPPGLSLCPRVTEESWGLRG